MWLKSVSGQYYNMITDTTVAVVESRGAGDFRVCVVNPSSNTAILCLQSGYRSREDAEEALDTLLEDQEVAALEVPDYSEEDAESEEEEDESTEDNYDELSNEELRAELSSRDLPVEGRKSAMITRLREDDTTRARATVL